MRAYRSRYYVRQPMSATDWAIAVAMALPVSLLLGVGIVAKLFG